MVLAAGHQCGQVRFVLGRARQKLFIYTTMGQTADSGAVMFIKLYFEPTMYLEYAVDIVRALGRA